MRNNPMRVSVKVLEVYFKSHPAYCAQSLNLTKEQPQSLAITDVRPRQVATTVCYELLLELSHLLKKNNLSHMSLQFKFLFMS